MIPIGTAAGISQCLCNHLTNTLFFARPQVPWGQGYIFQFTATFLEPSTEPGTLLVLNKYF